MTTITTKIAESGRTSFQLNGKRASKAAAIEAAIANMKNGSDNLVDIQIAIDVAKKTVRFDINYYGEIIWQEIKSVKQYKSIGGGYYETYYSPEWTRTTEERANELFAEFGLNTEIICKMVFADNTEGTTEADDTEVKAEDDNSNSIKTKKARKLYRINPVYKEDENPRYNVVDIFIENGVLKIGGLFECKNIETAYQRFVKCMTQAANEVTELKGWDEWEPAKKLTFDETEKIWLNENDEMIFDTKYTTDTLNVDINEDTIYIWGTFYMTAEAYRAAHPEEPNCNIELEVDNTVQVEETEEKFFYTTNRGNTYELTIGETGSTVRGRWYYYHEIGGMSEQDVIELAQSEGSEFVNALCKFIANDTDGSEEDDDETFTANVMPAENDDTDDELIDPAEKITAQVEDEPALVDCAYKFNLENGVREFKIGKYAEEIDAREKDAVRAHEPHEDVPDVEDNIFYSTPQKSFLRRPKRRPKSKNFSQGGKIMNERKPHVTHNTGRVEWYTPPAVIKAVRDVLGEIDLDPASTAEANQIVGAKNFFTKDDDGLKHDWLGKIFCNPPYSRGLIDKFVDKLRVERIIGHLKEAILLTNAATDTEWHERANEFAAAICFTRGRIKFLKPDGSPAASPTCGQVFFYYGNRVEKFIDVFSVFGACMETTRRRRIFHTEFLTNRFHGTPITKPTKKI